MSGTAYACHWSVLYIISVIRGMHKKKPVEQIRKPSTNDIGLKSNI
jgi:hypothetical protein